jgi:hypothetical protein
MSSVFYYAPLLCELFTEAQQAQQIDEFKSFYNQNFV